MTSPFYIYTGHLSFTTDIIMTAFLTTQWTETLPAEYLKLATTNYLDVVPSKQNDVHFHDKIKLECLDRNVYLSSVTQYAPATASCKGWELLYGHGKNPRVKVILSNDQTVTVWVQHPINLHQFSSMPIGPHIPDKQLFPNLTLNLKIKFMGDVKVLSDTVGSTFIRCTVHLKVIG